MPKAQRGNSYNNAVYVPIYAYYRSIYRLCALSIFAIFLLEEQIMKCDLGATEFDTNSHYVCSVKETIL